MVAEKTFTDFIACHLLRGIVYYRVSEKGNAISYVCSSAHLFPLFLLNQAIACVLVMTAASLGSKVKVRGQDAVGATSSEGSRSVVYAAAVDGALHTLSLIHI